MTTSNNASLLNYLHPNKVVMYTQGMENKVLEGYRLSVIRWKAPSEKMVAKGKEDKKHPALAVPVTAIAMTVMPQVLQEAMIEALQDMQDAAIRKHIEEKITELPGINYSIITIPEELGTPVGLAAFLSAKAESARLSKDGLTKWFDAVIADALVDAVASRLPPDTQHREEVAASQVEKAREAIISLASPRTNMPPNVAKTLLRAMQYAPSGDRTRGQLEVKLAIFANPPTLGELELAL